MASSAVRNLFCAVCLVGLASSSFACKAASPQMSDSVTVGDPGKKQLPSPAADAAVTFGKGAEIKINYNSPRMRGRKIFGGLVPYNQWWRTGANPATKFVTKTDIKIGNLNVPAGAYTLFTLPSEGTWQLILNKQTGQWGTDYDPKQDLGRVPMQGTKLGAPQENMTITFENKTANSVELHIRWETTEESVVITTTR